MSNISIGSITAEKIVVGDNNTIINHHGINLPTHQVLKREEYSDIINELIDQSELALETYLESKITICVPSNPAFIKILYKDILKVIEGLDFGDFDLVIENGDFVRENGDYKVKGKITKLHVALMYLHMKVVESFSNETIDMFLKNLEVFNNGFLAKEDWSSEYLDKLTSIRKRLEKDGGDKTILQKIFDNIEIKPSYFGVGVDIKGLYNSIFTNKRKRNAKT